MAETDGYWGEGYFAGGYWGEGYWGIYTVTSPTHGEMIGVAELRKRRWLLLRKVKAFLEAEASA